MNVDAIFVAAASGLVGSIATIIIKELLDSAKEQKKERLNMIDRKLSNIYAPLWASIGPGEWTLPTIPENDMFYERFLTNFHLLSSSLQDEYKSIYELVHGSIRGRGSKVVPRKEQDFLDANKEFREQLKNELDALLAQHRSLSDYS